MTRVWPTSSAVRAPTSSQPRNWIASTENALDQHRRVVDDLAPKAVRPPLGGDRSVSKNRHDIQHKAAFDAYVRKGAAGQLREIEQKALSAGSTILTAATSCRKTPNALSTAR